MKAMVLAAGHGVRMLPLTRFVPKPILPVLGRPMIEQILLRLSGAGYDRIAVNLHHLPEAMEALLGDRKDLGVEQLYFSREEELLGTAGGVGGASEFLRGSGTILVRNSDFLSDIDLHVAAETHFRSGCPVTMVLAPPREGYTEVPVDRDGRILGFGIGPPIDPARVAGTHLFTGLQFIEEEVLDLIPREGPSDLVRDVYLDLAADGAIASYLHDGFWWEFGNPENFLRGSLELLGMDPEEIRLIADTDPVRESGGARIAAGAGIDILQDAKLHGRVALGMASMVAENSILEDSVVMAESWIGPGCRLRNCIVGPGVEIPAGTELSNALVCGPGDPNLSLPPHVERYGDLLVRWLDLA